MVAPIAIYFALFSGVFLWENTVFGHKTVTVASYNIWNVMFQWDLRKLYIAEMINKANPDVIGFQEVRSDINKERNQLMELLTLIPQYKHYVYEPVASVTLPLGRAVGPPGWENEGLGLLSKHPIILSHVVNLTVDKNRQDRNKRVLLHVQVDIDGDEFDVTVVHFSYDKEQQCENAVDVINYIASTGSERAVLLGDFNAYNDFPWPVYGIMAGSFDEQGPCHPSEHFNPQDSSQGYGFVDAWVNVNGDTAGYTFSNMPTPGLVSRPDRILVSVTGLKVTSADILGDGKEYQKMYNLKSKWHRLKMAFAMAKEAAYGPRFKYTCHHDCGPHGSCRCGMCVKGGDQTNCVLTLCEECNAAHYNSFVFIFFLYASFAAFYVYILLKLALSTCFFRSRRLHLRLFFLCSNKTFGLAMFASLVPLYLITMWNIQDTLQTVNGRLPEEMFPSDHRMVVAKLQFTYR